MSEWYEHWLEAAADYFAEQMAEWFAEGEDPPADVDIWNYDFPWEENYPHLKED